MASLKLQAQRALTVIPSDTVAIPDPATEVISSATTATTATKLVDSAALFTSTDKVSIGAIVYNMTTTGATTVTAIDSDTTLSLADDIMLTTENYVIYNKPTDACVLYVGVAGDLDVEMSSGGSETFVAHPAGYAPLSVKQVNATGTAATDVIALW
jgi:hypothetical protein